MKEYTKPTILSDEDMAEGVFAGSGDCLTTTARIVQYPDNGNRTYRIQIDGNHTADHHANIEKVKVSFNLPVEYVSCSTASYCAGSGTSVLELTINYHLNCGPENVGLGCLVVLANDGLAINDCHSTFCDETCAQHGY